MFPSVAAMWVFQFLEWTESLLVARLNLDMRGLLKPLLLDMTETAISHAAQREAWLSPVFPEEFKTVALDGRVLKEILA